jgi:hypothetical protein
MDRESKYIEFVKEDIKKNTIASSDFNQVRGVYIKIIHLDCDLTSFMSHGSNGMYFMMVPNCLYDRWYERYGLTDVEITELFDLWYDDYLINLHKNYFLKK